MQHLRCSVQQWFQGHTVAGPYSRIVQPWDDKGAGPLYLNSCTQPLPVYPHKHSVRKMEESPFKHSEFLPLKVKYTDKHMENFLPVITELLRKLSDLTILQIQIAHSQNPAIILIGSSKTVIKIHFNIISPHTKPSSPWIQSQFPPKFLRFFLFDPDVSALRQIGMKNPRPVLLARPNFSLTEGYWDVLCFTSSLNHKQKDSTQK